MTPDEIRRLIGGYATGSLTEAERQTLFEAALEDQELFEELVREQGLKQLLDAPGAKARLIAALTKPEPVKSGGRFWRWAVAATLVAGGIALFIVLRPESKPVEMAAVRVAAPQTAPAIEAPRPTEPTKKATEPDDTSVPSKSDAPGQQNAPMAAPAPMAERSFARSAAMILAPRLAFDYVAESNFLTIKPAVDGYLRITEGSRVIFPTADDGHVVAGSSKRIELPPGIRELMIVYTGQSAAGLASAFPVTRTDAAGRVEDPSPTPSPVLVLNLRIPNR